MANDIGLPKEITLGEPKPPKKSRGMFLLIPLLLAALLFFQANTGMDKNVIIFYILLLLTASASLQWVMDFDDPKTLNELRKIKPFFFAFAYMLLFVLVIGVVFVLVYANTGGKPNFLRTSWELGLNYIGMQCIVVAPVETIFFQYVLPKTLNLSLSGVGAEGLSWGMSQVTFGLFHSSVYGWSLTAMLSAVMLGIIFLTLVKLSPVWGLGSAMGTHASLNVCITFFQLSSVVTIAGFGAI
jgi:hypothetical protein